MNPPRILFVAVAAILSSVVVYAAPAQVDGSVLPFDPVPSASEL